ncbi:hypothetical protein [Mesorhizobium sp. B1-1-5]|uniref:hypothetical protein n=1 Tax=Mesorhizobium sp. B1-1-5 TaxID=2589979 RepID=UPI00112EE29D|nr:hypothetical protein [Mesorhizobium sp. B1-1-5]TPN74233.1 hypothetical protein FJ980_31875 [Mesorhizobium sp. B1-1-5]
MPKLLRDLRMMFSRSCARFVRQRQVRSAQRCGKGQGFTEKERQVRKERTSDAARELVEVERAAWDAKSAPRAAAEVWDSLRDTRTEDKADEGGAPLLHHPHELISSARLFLRLNNAGEPEDFKTEAAGTSNLNTILESLPLLAGASWRLFAFRRDKSPSGSARVSVSPVSDHALDEMIARCAVERGISV